MDPWDGGPFKKSTPLIHLKITWVFVGEASLKLTASLPLKIGRIPKGNDRLPTTIFQGRTVSFREGNGSRNRISCTFSVVSLFFALPIFQQIIMHLFCCIYFFYLPIFQQIIMIEFPIYIMNLPWEVKPTIKRVVLWNC